MLRITWVQGDKYGSVEEDENKETVDGYYQTENGDLLVVCSEEMTDILYVILPIEIICLDLRLYHVASCNFSTLVCAVVALSRFIVLLKKSVNSCSRESVQCIKGWSVSFPLVFFPKVGF